ncbi:hypothetical protein F4778DRAFT_746424 [Xylariomycetidae sp. FL2044]|nr:hypothetical protein F4778DRAFT_746424 [Xylariomycetidae sp. FL2044]
MRLQVLTYNLLVGGIAGHAIRSSSSAQQPPNLDCKATGRAVYLLTNDEVNSVVALPINSDGTLSPGTVTPSGGNGSSSISGTTMEPAGPDALVSQSSLAIADKYIFVVNAGSNSISMMSIAEDVPTQLAVVGKPAAVPGDFPNTVAASAKNNLVCAATTGELAGISCGSFSDKGIDAMDALRPIDLGQSTPPVGPTNTVSQTLFSPDESRLYTMVKGDPSNNKTGFVSVLPIERKTTTCGGGSVTAAAAAASSKDVRSTPLGTAVLFGSQNIPGTNNVFATDASFGAAVLAIDPETQEVSVAHKGVIDGQRATCWAAIASTGTAFVTDVAVPRLVEMSIEDASIVQEYDLSAGGDDPGFVDLKGAGGFLYVLSPGNGTTGAAVVVMDVSEGQGRAKLVQRFGLEGVAGKSAQGMAILA